MALKPDEIGAAIVLALDEQDALKGRQEASEKRLERLASEAAQNIEKASGRVLAEAARLIAEKAGELSSGLSLVGKSVEALERRPLERIVERQPVIEQHFEEKTVIQPDGSGVKSFKREENKDVLVLETNDGTRHKVKLPDRVVQHIDRGGGGGSRSQVKVDNVDAEIVFVSDGRGSYTMRVCY